MATSKTSKASQNRKSMKINNKNRKAIVKIVLVGLSIFTIYAIVSVIMIYSEIKIKQQDLQQTNMEIQQVQVLNDEITTIIEKGINEQYIIKMAREKLGLVFPNEMVYIDMGSK